MSAAPKACPWAVPTSTAPHGAADNAGPSLTEVMSEQLASEMMRRDLSELPSNVETDLSGLPQELLLSETRDTTAAAAAAAEGVPVADDQCDDDVMIARMLQMQFDREADEELRKEERHHNGQSKVTVSYSKYKTASLEADDWPDEDSEDDDPDWRAYLAQDDRKRHWDCYETADKETGQLPRCGYKRVGSTIVTKHDRELSQRSNGKRVMEFPPGIETGDGGGFDLQLSNRVYNHIRNFSLKDGKRRGRLHDKEDKSTQIQAVDTKTQELLFKMVDQGILERVNGQVSTGKEAVILHADGPAHFDDEDDAINDTPNNFDNQTDKGDGTQTEKDDGTHRDNDDDEEEEDQVPLAEYAIKVFKTSLNEFKTRDKYIKDDFRFKARYSKQNPRKIVVQWAEKEMHNLMKMARFDIPVPRVLLLKKHVLVMSFLGHSGTPAPKLRDAQLSVAELEQAYEQVVSAMQRLYDKCHLVHADLSPYNILWHEKKCWFIDVSQSVEPNQPHGLEFLMRDCYNITDFFRRSLGPDACLSPQQLFTKITGLPIKEGEAEAETIMEIRDYEKNHEILTGLAESEKDYPFEYCWKKSHDDKAEGLQQTPAWPIPGHARSGNGKCKSGKSPKSPKFAVSGKSPKSPTSSLASLTDVELKQMKDKYFKSENESSEAREEVAVLERKPSQVKFQDESDFPPSS